MRSNLHRRRVITLPREAEFSDKLAVSAEEYRTEIVCRTETAVCTIKKGERVIGEAAVRGDSWQFHRFCAEIAFRDETGWNYFTAVRVFRYFFALCAVDAEYTEDLMQVLRRVWLDS